MSTLVKEKVEALAIHFDGDILGLELSDGRQVLLPMRKIKWLDWLLKATPEQRAKWTILPYGYGVYWEELDDGFEVQHALSIATLV